MKYICLGYMDEEVWEKMSESERTTFMDECFVYDEELKKKRALHRRGGPTGFSECHHIEMAQ